MTFDCVIEEESKTQEGIEGFAADFFANHFADCPERPVSIDAFPRSHRSRMTPVWGGSFHFPQFAPCFLPFAEAWEWVKTSRRHSRFDRLLS